MENHTEDFVKNQKLEEILNELEAVNFKLFALVESRKLVPDPTEEFQDLTNILRMNAFVVAETIEGVRPFIHED